MRKRLIKAKRSINQDIDILMSVQRKSCLYSAKGIGSTSFFNISLISINRARPILASLEVLQDEMVILKFQGYEQFAQMVQAGSSLFVLAHLVVANGNIIPVKSVGNPSLQKDDNSASYILSFQPNLIYNGLLGNIFDQTNRVQETISIRNNLIKFHIKEEVNIVYGKLPYKGIGTVVESIIGHSSAKLGADCKKARKKFSRNRNFSDNAENAALSTKQYSDELLQLINQEPTRCRNCKLSAREVMRGIYKNETYVEDNQADVEDAVEDEIEQKQNIVDKLNPTYMKTVKLINSDFDGYEILVRNHANERANIIIQQASTLDWPQQAIQHIMTGETCLEQSRNSTSDAEANKRNSFRVYFKDFPIIVRKNGVSSFAQLLNISETGNSIFLTSKIGSDNFAFEQGDDLELSIPQVGQAFQSITCIIVSRKMKEIKDDTMGYWYGMSFPWVENDIPPPADLSQAILHTSRFMLATRKAIESQK
ncbi:MAG: PilZ domain-containing protein [Magnetococcales bacterium]|nr:PilZ domain-containing protein [Magnetococcales bacterium]